MQSTAAVPRHGHISRRRARVGDERGAVAVEFALIFPVLVLLLVGIIEFGTMFNAQLLVQGAAREGAREMAVSGSVADAQAAALGVAPGLAPALTSADVTVSATTCTDGADITVTVHYDKPFLTGMFGTTMPLEATATRQCFG
jgi:Flp pilus assembly protein TadG